MQSFKQLALLLALIGIGLAHREHCAFGGDCLPDYDSIMVFQSNVVTNFSAVVGIDYFRTALASEGIDPVLFETLANNHYLFQYGVDFRNVTPSGDPLYYKIIPGVVGLIPFVFNPVKNLNYRAKLVGGNQRNIEDFECSELKVYAFDVIIFNQSALGGYWKNRILIPGTVPDASYFTFTFTANVISYENRHGQIKKKRLIGCNLIPATGHYEVSDNYVIGLRQNVHTVFIDMDTGKVGDSAREVNFIPAFPAAGEDQTIKIRHTFNFPAHLSTYGIHDITCNPTAA